MGANEACHGAEIVGQHDQPLAPLEKIAEGERQSWSNAGRTFDRIGKFRRMGTGEGDHWQVAVAQAYLGSCGGNGDRGMGIDQRARSGIGLGDGVHRLSVVDLVCGKQAARHVPPLVILGHAAIPAEASHRLGDSYTITPFQLEQQSLEIARHLDVHARAELGSTGESAIRPVAK